MRAGSRLNQHTRAKRKSVQAGPTLGKFSNYYRALCNSPLLGFRVNFFFLLYPDKKNIFSDCKETVKLPEEAAR
jgi:hypothetical protein